jgi:Fe-S-cluster containining protein
MNLWDKSNRVIELYKELDFEIYLYKNSTGVECVPQCKGECCKREDIYATTLEFLPLAFMLFQQNREEVIERIYSTESKICLLFDENTGRCTEYNYRGLICRLFGFSSIRLKDGSLSIVSCGYIKSAFKRAIESQIDPIIMADYHKKLMGIDLELAKEESPINIAIRRAVEKVGLFIKYGG